MTSRVWVVAVAAATLVAAMAAPSQAATIPPPPAQCQPPASTPVVDDVTISPQAINTSAGAKPVTVSVQVHDSVAISTVVVSLRLKRSWDVTLTGIEQASARLTLSAGTPTAGTWSGSLTVPRWGRVGTWIVDRLDVEDVAQGWASYQPDRPGRATPRLQTEWGSGWDSSVAVAGHPDTAPPTISGLRAGAHAVDARTRSVPVAFTVTARDRQSGLASVEVVLVEARRGITGTATLRRSTGSTWTGRATISRWVGTGQWRFMVVARDRAGNTRTLTPSALAARGWASRLAVRSGTDTTPPRLVSMAFPASVDTTAGPVRVPVTVRVADVRSGITAVPRVGFGPRQLPGLMVVYLDGPTFRVSSVTGSPHDRTFHGYVDLPQCWQTGDWYPSVDVTDAAGNLRPYDEDELVPPLVSGPFMHYESLDMMSPFFLARVVNEPPHQAVMVEFTEPTLLDRDPGQALAITTESGAEVPGTWQCRDALGSVRCQDDAADVTRMYFTPTTQPVRRATWTVRWRGTYPDLGIYDLSGNPADPSPERVEVGPGQGYSWFAGDPARLRIRSALGSWATLGGRSAADRG